MYLKIMVSLFMANTPNIQVPPKMGTNKIVNRAIALNGEKKLKHV